MPRYSFRQRVLVLAAVLVTSIQLLTLVPVLNAIKADVEDRARQSVTIGAAVFEEFMLNRTEQLRTTVDVLASDFGFKQVVAGSDTNTIRSALVNHSARVDADIALLLDLDGKVVASFSVGNSELETSDLRDAVEAAGEADVAQAVVYARGIPYQTIAVPLRAPLPIAWAVMGFQIDSSFAARIESLTGLKISFLRLESGQVSVLASTLTPLAQAELAARLDTRMRSIAGLISTDLAGTEFLTELRPFSPVGDNVRVALHLSLYDALAPYRNIRSILLFVTLASLLAAISGAFWLARTVTEPVNRLVAAARRMRAGVYSEPLEAPGTDELGELAQSFNAMQEAIAEREARIVYQAHHDDLTGLPNRDRLQQLLQTAMSTEQALTIISISLDRFGRIASSLGQRASDELVKLVADVLRRRLHDKQFLGHFGGNEFAVVLPGNDLDAASRWLEHTQHLLHAGVKLSGANISLQACGGIAVYPEHSRDPADLLRCAATARSKAQSKNDLFSVYVPGEEARYREQIKIIGDFPNAIRSNQLCIYFQPKIECRNQAVVGAEALVRWNHPELGLLPPSAFVDVIEQAGSIRHLTRWVIQEAADQCRRWQDRNLPLTVAINISVMDLLDENLPYYLLEVTRERGLDASSLTLEITENAIMHDISKSLIVLRCIRDLGFRISLDDFGTGQSSLIQLKRLALNEVKIDKSFVMGVLDHADHAIVRSTIDLAHNLGLQVVAEGVESVEALEQLVALNCEYAQGFYISEPVPADDFVDWVHSWQRGHGADVIRIRRSPADRS
jgi:diguanylate cyclase (GGDEF)-like protein